MAGDWDLTLDSDIQDELVDKLNESADKFDGQVDNLYSKIDSMGTAWVGEDYDAFKEGTNGYNNALHDLADGMRLYAIHFDKVSGGTTELSDSIIDLIETCTLGKDGALGGNKPQGSNGYTAGDNNYTGNPNGNGQGGEYADNGQYSGQGGYNAMLYDANGNPITNLNGYQGPIYDSNGNMMFDSNGNYVYDPNSPTATVSQEEFEQMKAQNPGFWATIGGRYKDDWVGFTEDVKHYWSKADGLISGAYALYGTLYETSLFLFDGAVDTVEFATDGVTYVSNWLFDLGTGRGGSTNADYWSNIGKDYAENWDYSGCDDFWDYAGTTVMGLGRTVVDAGQTVVNAADWTIDKVGEGVSWVVDKGADLAGDLFGWIFD